MIEEILNSYALALSDVRTAVEDLTGELMIRQFPGVPNHPAWTLGHLVYSAQAIGGEVGESSNAWSRRSAADCA